eukprot:748458-Pleurochrysis_carterae.AAC.1
MLRAACQALRSLPAGMLATVPSPGEVEAAANVALYSSVILEHDCSGAVELVDLFGKRGDAMAELLFTAGRLRCIMAMRPEVLSWCWPMARVATFISVSTGFPAEHIAPRESGVGERTLCTDGGSVNAK